MKLLDISDGVIINLSYVEMIHTKINAGDELRLDIAFNMTSGKTYLRSVHISKDKLQEINMTSINKHLMKSIENNTFANEVLETKKS